MDRPDDVLTETTVDHMVDAYTGGRSLAAIGDAHGVPWWIVRTRLRERGVLPRARPGRRYPDDPDWWARQLQPRLVDGVWLRGDLVRLADRFGVTTQAIRRRLATMGVEHRREGTAPDPHRSPEAFDDWVVSATQPDGECRRWVFARRAYPYPTVRQDGDRRPVHHLVWARHHGALPPGQEISHVSTCVHSDCLNPFHLVAMTPRARLDGLVVQGAFPHGDAHWWAKLSHEQAVAVLESSASAEDEARRMGVSPSTVRAIRSGRRWKHLQREVTGATDG